MGILPAVSVIIPVFRSEDILARALGSLLSQDLRDWEAIVVDDGSPEASWRVIQAYGWLDPRIRVIRHKHGGVCAARNTGIAESSGAFLLFLDADDWLEPQALSTLVECCRNQNACAAHGGLRYVMPDGSPTDWTGGHAADSPLFESLAQSNVLSVPSCVLLRRSVLDEVGQFDTTLAHCGDWDLWARVARHEGLITHTGQIVTDYRMRPGSLSRNPRTLLRDAMVVLRRIHSPDARVGRPGAGREQGCDREKLACRVAHFAVYASALAAGGGTESAIDPVLDLVQRWTPLDAQQAGHMVFYALCFANCCGPEDAARFWPQVAPGVEHLLDSIQRRTGLEGLADWMWDTIEACGGSRILPDPPALTPPVTAERLRASADTLAYGTLRALAEQRGPML